MKRVYFSYLGMGVIDKEKGNVGYQETVYELNGRRAEKTKFVQAAEIELLGADAFDRFLIAATEKSYQAHWEALESQLAQKGVKALECLLVDEDMGPENQWKWFEQIMARIEPGDALTIDMTHGYRAFSIVMSAAVHFLQKARNVDVTAVYYGAFDRNRALAPIVDLKDFFTINQWADAVTRLVDDADAGRLAQLAGETPDFQFGGLNDPDIIQAMQNLTDAVRNVDVNNISDIARLALKRILEKKKTAARAENILLDLMIDKFGRLSTDAPMSGKYDQDYFRLQIEIIKMLLQHRLYMQAFTAMREFIASIGLIPDERARTMTAKGKKRRKCFAEVFTKMVEINQQKWKFSSHGDGKTPQDYCNELLPFYSTLEKTGIYDILKQFSKELMDYRNGFDHAWTMKKGAYKDIEQKGRLFLEKLETVVDKLAENRLL